MSSTELLQPILDGGIRSVKFFNGRLLSGEDMSDEQAANHEGRDRLGQAMGEGVAFGLEVSEAAGLSKRDAPVLTINAGMAVNRQGQTLKLAAANSVSLIRQTVADTSAPSGAIFKDRQQTQVQSSVYIAGAGVYLLTIAPAEGSAGRAPVSGLGNTAITCNARYTVEGVKFRLLQLNISNADLSNPALLRNRVAYKCFGTSIIANDSFTQQASAYGLLETLRPNSLTDYDVPLALIYWTASGGITFLDQWAARRRLTRHAASDRLAHFLGDRRASETEAMLLQFDEHIQDIAAREKKEVTRKMAASERFEFLPPAGIVPISNGPALPGFNSEFFFHDIASGSQPVINASLLRTVFHEALNYEPVDLGNKQQVRLFVIRGNANALVFVNEALGRRFQYLFDELDV
jgi:hypothetical protein